jgi:hypothetical protein
MILLSSLKRWNSTSLLFTAAKVSKHIFVILSF